MFSQAVSCGVHMDQQISLVNIIQTIVYTAIHEFTDMPMDGSHPLVAGIRRCLQVTKEVSFETAAGLRTDSSYPVLLRDHLRVGTWFTGMAGGEMACFLASSQTGLLFRLVNQCDVTAEAMAVTHPFFLMFFIVWSV